MNVVIEFAAPVEQLMETVVDKNCRKQIKVLQVILSKKLLMNIYYFFNLMDLKALNIPILKQRMVFIMRRKQH